MFKCDGVFEGGGVKGIGFAGAIAAFEEKGYRFEYVAGASAGAIAASLITAGYTGEEIKRELTEVNFNDFKQKSTLGLLGYLGSILNTVSRYGIYRADYFEQWLTGLLQKKGVRYFKDIKTANSDEKYMYKFQAVASDLSDNRLLVLPRDLCDFGIEPDDFEIAKAVRMSMSIPVFFEPYRLIDSSGKPHIIVDGGLLSNYPIWLLDDGGVPERPTFGFRFLRKNGIDNQSYSSIDNFIDYSESLLKTMMEANDNYHISLSKGDYDRTILIPTAVKSGNGFKSIKTTDFDITDDECAAMAANGESAANRFLSGWNFQKWKDIYRA